MASTSTKKKTTAKPGKQPRDRFAPSAWTRASIKPEEVTLPSGNVCLARRPGPAEILQSGLMPDSLMPIINEAIRSGKGMPKDVEKDLLGDPQQLFELMEGMDKAIVAIVVEPPVLYHKELSPEGKWVLIPEDDRDTEAYIYTDEIDEEDKMFLFNFAVGGTRDLDQFRRESAERLGNVADDAGDGDSA